MKSEMEKITVYASGIVCMAVCVEVKTQREEIEREANRQLPTGIKSLWEITDESFDEGNPNPCPCNDSPGRLHYLLHC